METTYPKDPQPATEPEPQPDPGPESQPLWFEEVFDRSLCWLRVNSPANEPSRWLAGVGALLLLLAGVFMTIANWKQISPPVRLGGIVAVNVAVIALGERFRKRLPDVGRALDHLGAGLLAATGIQAVSTIGRVAGYAPVAGRWALCCAVGGTVAAAALEIQHRRLKAALMRSEQVVAVVLAGIGVAALTGVPVGVTGALLAATAFAIRRPNFAATLSIVSLATPFIGAGFDSWGFGTAQRLGATTQGTTVLGWAAPLTAVIAGAVLALVGLERRRSDRATGRAMLTIGAIGGAVNLILGASEFGLPGHVWLWAFWGAIAALAIGTKNRVAVGLAAAALPAATAIQMALLDADHLHYFWAMTCFLGAAVSVTAIAAARFPRGRVDLLFTAGQALAAAAALGMVPAADVFDQPAADRLRILAMLLVGAVVAIAGYFESSKPRLLVGATLVAFAVLGELGTIPTAHLFDTLPLLAIALGAAEAYFRSKGTIATRYAYLASSSVFASYLVAGQINQPSSARAAIALAGSCVLIAVGTLRKENTVALVGAGTLATTLVLQVGPTLATFPVWAQLALGGLVLFGLAVLTERHRHQPNPTDL